MGAGDRFILCLASWAQGCLSLNHESHLTQKEKQVSVLASGFSDPANKSQEVCVFSHTLVLLSLHYSHRKVTAQIQKLWCMYSTNNNWRKILVWSTLLGAYWKNLSAPVIQATCELSPPCNIIKLRLREIMAYSFPWCLSAQTHTAQHFLLLPKCPSYQVRAALQSHVSATTVLNRAGI